MLPFQKNDYIPGTGNPFYDIPYIRSYPFLDLETLRDGIGDAGNFRQSDDAPSGNISHSRLHIVHEGDMVLAMGKEGNIFHHHHVTFRRRKCLIESAGDFFIGHRRIGQLLGHHFRKAAGRFHKPFSFGIFPDCFYNQARCLFQFFLIHFRPLSCPAPR